MAETKKENMDEMINKAMQVIRIILNWLSKSFYAVTLIVAVSCGIGLWHFCLTSPVESSWYRDFLETYLWCNWFISIYVIYFFIVGGHHLFYSANERSIIIYSILFSGTIAAFFTVPALYSVRSIYFGCSFHWLFTIGLVLWLIIEVVSLIINSRIKRSISSPQIVDVHWESYVKSILSFIEKTMPTTEESFTIGIAGSWGSGKTTVLGSIINKLKNNKKYIVRTFNPWKMSSSKQINTEFFGLLTSIVEKNRIDEGRIVSIIKKYVQLLTLVPNTSINGIEQILNVLPMDSEKSLSALHKEIDSFLDKLDRRIVICIDDLDRLDFNELYEVLKIIRVSANFKNIIFIVAYDKGYVAANLNSHHIPNGEEFLKKIVNVELCLPAFEKYILGNLLWDLICPYMPNDTECKQEILVAMRSAITQQGAFLINEYFRNFRDVYRFANTFSILLLYLNQQQENDVTTHLNYGDLLWIEVLHYFSEDTYNMLRNDYWKLLDEKQTNKSILELKKEIKLTDNDRSCLLYLFPNKTNRYTKNGIHHSTTLPGYFSYTILDDALPYGEFMQVLNDSESREILQGHVSEWLSGRKVNAFINTICHYTHYSTLSEQATLNFLRAMLLTASKYPTLSSTNKSLRRLFGDLCNSPMTSRYKISNNVVIEELSYAINNYNMPETMNHFLTQLTVSYDYNEDPEDQPYISILNLEEIKNLAAQNFQKYLELTTEVPNILDLLKSNNNIKHFVESASYLVSYYSDDDTHESNEYSNLIDNAILTIYSAHETKFNDEQFREMMDPLVHEVIADGMSELIPDVQQTIQQLFGTYESFNQFINTHFEISEETQYTYITYLGLQKK